MKMSSFPKYLLKLCILSTLLARVYSFAAIATCRGGSYTDVTRCIQQTLSQAERAGDSEVDLPQGTYMISQPLVIPNKTKLIGTGRGDVGLTGTTILASGSFPLGAPLVQLGPAPGPNFGVQIHSLTLNCNARAGIGLQNLYSEELSYGKDLLISNCGAIGLDVEGGAAQNSGPFQNLEIYPGSGTTVNAATICVKVVNAIAFRGVTGLTCNAGTYYSGRPNVALQLDGGASYQDIHVEHFATAIALGSSVTSADGMSIVNSQFGPDVAVGIKIQAGPPNQNLMILGASCFGCSTLLSDDLTGNNITDESLGWYFIGNGANGGKTTLSSKYGLTTQMEGPLRSWNLAIGAGNAQNWGTVSLWDATPSGVTSFVEAQGAGQGQQNLFEWRDTNFGLLSSVASDGSFHAPYFQMAPLSAALACEIDKRGTQQFLASSPGIPDHLMVCAQLAGGSYGWVKIF